MLWIRYPSSLDSSAHPTSACAGCNSWLEGRQDAHQRPQYDFILQIFSLSVANEILVVTRMKPRHAFDSLCLGKAGDMSSAAKSCEEGVTSKDSSADVVMRACPVVHVCTSVSACSMIRHLLKPKPSVSPLLTRVTTILCCRLPSFAKSLPN